MDCRMGSFPAVFSRSFDELHADIICLSQRLKTTNPKKAVVLVVKIELLVEEIQP